MNEIKRKQKLLMLGLDAALPDLIMKFTEGGNMPVTKKLIEKGVIPKDESILVCITGNGLKTQEPLTGKIGEFIKIKPNMDSFEKILKEVQ